MSAFKDIFRRLLVISPHADDEVLGVGGTIARVLSEVSCTHVRVVVMGTTNVTNSETGYHVTTAEREKEFADAMSVLNECRPNGSTLDHFVLYPGKELALDKLRMRRIVTDLDSVIGDFGPTAVLVCYESHHQDHQMTAKAAIAAMRPSPSNRIPFKGLFEYGYIDAWSAPGQARLSKLYVDISSYLGWKLRAFQAYKSQQRPNPADIRSLESITALAKTRGIESGVQYAEAFMPLSISL